VTGVQTCALPIFTAIQLVRDRPWLRRQLTANTIRFRELLTRAGYEVLPGRHPVVPVMLRGGTLAHDVAADLRRDGVLVFALAHPVVPGGQERIRVQISAAHTAEHLELAAAAFTRAAERLQPA